MNWLKKKTGFGKKKAREAEEARIARKTRETEAAIRKALLALLLWLGEYSQKMGAKPMISDFIWFSPQTKEIFFTIVYFFSTIAAFLVVAGLIGFIVWQAIGFLRQKIQKPPSDNLGLNDLENSIDDSIKNLLKLKDSLDSYKANIPQKKQTNETNVNDDM